MESFYKNEYRTQMEDLFIESKEVEFSDKKALELLLLFALPIQSAGAVADKLIEHFGSFSNVIRASFDELIEVGGMDKDCAVLIRLADSLSERADKETQRSTVLSDYTSSVAYFKEKLLKKNAPKLLFAALDGKLAIINSGEVQKSAEIYGDSAVSQITAFAKNEGAACVIIALNIDGVDGTPDSETGDFINRLRASLAKNSISLNDVIIIGDNGSCAFSNDLRLALYL